jgi:hypothetical protein
LADPHSPRRHGMKTPAGNPWCSRRGHPVPPEEWEPLQPGEDPREHRI